MALIDRDHSGVGTELATHVVGVVRPARVIEPSPYDSAGSAMRG
jgi:dimethylglycine dehydrogenase